MITEHTSQLYSHHRPVAAMHDSSHYTCKKGGSLDKVHVVGARAGPHGASREMDKRGGRRPPAIYSAALTLQVQWRNTASAPAFRSDSRILAFNKRKNGRNDGVMDHGYFLFIFFPKKIKKIKALPRACYPAVIPPLDFAVLAYRPPSPSALPTHPSRSPPALILFRRALAALLLQ